MKVRLDQLLVDLGLVDSRTKAQAYIRAGEVFVDEQRIDKPGTPVLPDSNIRVATISQDVSRGAEKLRTALDTFPIQVEGLTAADLGSSTGGFTQVLLERGAIRVHAFDVGYGILHERIRTDPRVIVHERVNVRHLNGTETEPVDLVVLDLSFIGIPLVLPAVHRISKEDMNGVALVKPQFEAGRGKVGRGGVIRDVKVLREVLEKHLTDLHAENFVLRGLVPSRLKGKKGNQEYLSWFQKIDGGTTIPFQPDWDLLLGGGGNS